ncbi:MAG: type III-A CRISPR-associated RAMP protein Csm3 [Bacteroidales bacterium]|nr:type III-A CRISPR-associated RAMP protein Csm3 [Bacteroidales bacterium]
MKLKGKIFINGRIKALTGLHIGGSNADVAIGDIDNCVIKTSEGVPYIPGSSLKGKLRILLEKKEGLPLCDCGKKDCNICVIFGNGANKRSVEAGPTRLIVRDCHLAADIKSKMENKEDEFRELELIYTESKWENQIDRLTSRAEHPRQTERVPQGAEFDMQMVFNLLEVKDLQRFVYLISGLYLLEDDYLGGNGSRGYGRIQFKGLEIAVKTIAQYEGPNEPVVLYSGMLSDFSQAKDSFLKKLEEMLEE